MTLYLTCCVCFSLSPGTAPTFTNSSTRCPPLWLDLERMHPCDDRFLRRYLGGYDPRYGYVNENTGAWVQWTLVCITALHPDSVSPILCRSISLHVSLFYALSVSLFIPPCESCLSLSLLIYIPLFPPGSASVPHAAAAAGATQRAGYAGGATHRTGGDEEHVAGMGDRSFLRGEFGCKTQRRVWIYINGA